MRKFRRAVAFGILKQYKDLIEIAQPHWDYIRDYESANKGSNILHTACLNGRKELIVYLLNNGWEKRINEYNENKFTPFQLFLIKIGLDMKNEMKIVKLLIEKGADIFKKDKNNQNGLERFKTNWPEHPSIPEIEEIYNLKRKESAFIFYNFYRKYTKKGQESFLNKLPPHYRKEIEDYF